jgi:hypothetical protein
MIVTNLGEQMFSPSPITHHHHHHLEKSHLIINQSQIKSIYCENNNKKEETFLSAFGTKEPFSSSFHLISLARIDEMFPKRVSTHTHTGLMSLYSTLLLRSPNCCIKKILCLNAAEHKKANK